VDALHGRTEQLNLEALRVRLVVELVGGLRGRLSAFGILVWKVLYADRPCDRDHISSSSGTTGKTKTTKTSRTIRSAFCIGETLSLWL
jgi:hypothetical protein